MRPMTQIRAWAAMKGVRMRNLSEAQANIMDVMTAKTTGGAVMSWEMPAE